MYDPFLKRVLDFFAALFGLILLFPIILFITIVLVITNQGKPFFFQDRPGKNGKIFSIIKFKTMIDINPNYNHDVHSPVRITKIGSYIRKYSLDEILQLVNVLKGDMSLVGPRPLLVEYLPLYNNEQNKRHLTKPGITGWAQIHGRNSISWEKKFEYDIWYIENISFKLDFHIFLQTILKVFKKEGVNMSNKVIMPAWNGNSK